MSVTHFLPTSYIPQRQLRSTLPFFFLRLMIIGTATAESCVRGNTEKRVHHFQPPNRLPFYVEHMEFLRSLSVSSRRTIWVRLSTQVLDCWNVLKVNGSLVRSFVHQLVSPPQQSYVCAVLPVTISRYYRFILSKHNPFGLSTTW